MAYLIWGGAVVSILGLAGLIWCITLAARARREGLEGEDMQQRLQGLVALNMASLGISGLGLMMVIAGIFLS